MTDDSPDDNSPMEILLIPGFMLDSGLWCDVEPALRQFGSISHADLTQDDTLAAMAHRALREAPPSFVVIGFSMGGYVAREIVRQAPERVSALILIATSARGDNEVQVQRKAALTSQTENTVFRGLSSTAIASSLHPDNTERSNLILRIQTMSLRLGRDTFRRQSLLKRHDELDQLSAINCPTLVIAGEQDKLRTQAEAMELHEGIATSDFAVIKETGHMIPLEAPGPLIKVIGDWLDKQFCCSKHRS